MSKHFIPIEVFIGVIAGASFGLFGFKAGIIFVMLLLSCLMLRDKKADA